MKFCDKVMKWCGAAAVLAMTLTTQAEAAGRVPAPNRIWISSDSQTQLTIHWNGGGGSTAGYFIAFAGGSKPTVCTNGSKIGLTTAYTRSDLAPNSTYSVTVCAFDRSGNVSMGISATQATQPTQAWVPAPSGFFINADSQTQFTMMWNSGGGSTTGFYVAFASGTTATVCTNGSRVGIRTQYTRSDLAPDRTYTVTVCAYDVQGNVSEGISATQTTLGSQGYVPAPFDLTAFSDGPTRLTMNWSSGDGNTAGFFIAFAGGTVPTVCTNGSRVGMKTTYTRTDLDPGATYSVTVCAYDSQGNVSEGVSVTQTTFNGHVVIGPVGGGGRTSN